jgi:FKBP-type peptidyl-prolyl cis-trans isomerase FkpA
LHPKIILKMKNRILFLFALSISLFSCKPDDDTAYVPPRDFGEQYANEIVEIEEYLNTHYITVSGSEVTIKKIPENGTQTPISEHPNLTFKTVDKHDIQYKLYYLKLNEGENQRPSHVDSVFVNYRGFLTDNTQFDNRPNPIWLTLDTTIEGFAQIMPEFKTGTYNTATESFEGSGFGVVFIPSGLGYYNIPPQSAPEVGYYNTLVFSFSLNTLRYRDHDLDGIPSYLEVANLGDDPRKYDSDGDETPNYLDIDDDNDGTITKKEIEDENGDPLPFDQIPTCQGGTVKVHLDPACY